MSLTTNIEPEYDIILAGGGTASCVIAGRLADASPDLKILVLEAGPSTKDELTHTQPARFLSHFLPTSSTVRFHFDKKSEALGGRQSVIIQGQCLGGGSSVNFGMYTRGSASDYDAWQNNFQNPGWGFDDLKPLFQKTETCQFLENADTHGYHGPLKVSYGGHYTNTGKAFLDTVAQLDKNRKVQEVFDGNDFTSTNVYTRWAKWIDGETGKRSDVAHYYIYNRPENSNLHVATGALVKRVIVENGTATGVEYQWNPRFHENADNSVKTVRAKRMVVVSGGTFGSPAILERSGIGAKSNLEKVGVKSVVDLPGVGESYQDHNIVFTPYVAAPEAETLDAIMRNETDEMSVASGQWFKNGKGLLASNGVDLGMKCRPTDEELAQWGPEFKKYWDSDFADKKDKPAIWIGMESGLLGDPTVVAPRKYFTTGCFTTYPLSRGHVHITSADDVNAPYDFRTGFLENIADVMPHVWAYKYTREIARRMSVFRGEAAPLHPKFPAGSKAAVVEDAMPFALDAPKIEYTAEDDKAIVQYVRGIVATCWHSMGTAAMKPREEGGVVDSKLSVYGVKGLKVADLSICPSNVGGNTYSTALVVGEKAAVLIGEELGLKNV